MFVLSDISTEFVKDIQDFIKVMYNSGQAILQNYRATSKEPGKTSSTLNPSTLVMQSIVACIEVLRLAIREESGTLYICNSIVIIPTFITVFTEFFVNF